MRGDTQFTQEERYQIEGLLQTGRQHSKIVRYGNVLASRLRISYSQESTHLLHLRVESALQYFSIQEFVIATLPSFPQIII